MDSNTTDRWRGILEDIGVHPLPPLLKKEGTEKLRKLPRQSSRSFQVQPLLLEFNQNFPRRDSPRERQKEIRNELKKELDKYRGRTAVYKELRTRARGKLFLFPHQVAHSPTGERSTEARGIDYPAKLRLIRQALHDKSSLLEIHEGAGRDRVKRMLHPLELDTSGEEVMLRGRSYPEEEEAKVRVGKISYLKLWRAGLFFS